MALYAADERSTKIDLGVGVFRDAQGRSPIIAAVAAAEAEIARTETTKSYLPLRGHDGFLARMRELILAEPADQRISALQCVGGTGGVYLGLALAAMANPAMKVIIGTPTWPNHIAICDQLGLPVLPFRYYDVASQRVLIENLHDAIRNGRPGDVLILHGPCHNPTGADLDWPTLEATLELASRHGMIPLVDAAYYGLNGGLENDIALMRRIMAAAPEAMLVISCSKMFSLYRERTGVLFIAASNAAAAAIAQANAERIARCCYSMPPAHGAATVALVLERSSFHRQWRAEVEDMRLRLQDVRADLATQGSDITALGAVIRQRGIFSLLPISPTVVNAMAREHGIYMPQSGRINIAGFKQGDVTRFTDALRSVLARSA